MDELDSVVRHRRSPRAIIAAALRPESYTAVARAFLICHSPVDFLRRYLSKAGTYPSVMRLRTPIGDVAAQVYAPDDIQTINEIFLRGDYALRVPAKVVVDFGSNIGISALYFLSREPSVTIYCFEPLPQNIERLKVNLAPFIQRFVLEEKAVGTGAGIVSFGWEPTGRYGGIGRETGRTIEVDCLDSNDVLAEIAASHPRIDLLKIDVETLEKIILERIPVELRRRIDAVVVEYPFKENPIADTHDWTQNNNIGRFVLRPEARI